MAKRCYPLLSAGRRRTNSRHDGRVEEGSETAWRRAHLPSRSEYYFPYYRLCSSYWLTVLAADVQNCTRAALWPVRRMFRCHWGAHDADLWGSSEACVHDYYGWRGPDERGLRGYVRTGEASFLFLYTSVLIPILTTSGCRDLQIYRVAEKAVRFSYYV